MDRVSRVDTHRATQAVSALASTERATVPLSMQLLPYRRDWASYNAVAYGSLILGVLLVVLALMAGAPAWVWWIITAVFLLGVGLLARKVVVIRRDRRNRR